MIQEVRWLDIAVYDTSGVYVLERPHQVTHVVPHGPGVHMPVKVLRVRRFRTGCLYAHPEIVGNMVWHHNEYLIVLAEGGH